MNQSQENKYGVPIWLNQFGRAHRSGFPNTQAQQKPFGVDDAWRGPLPAQGSWAEHQRTWLVTQDRSEPRPCGRLKSPGGSKKSLALQPSESSLLPPPLRCDHVHQNTGKVNGDVPLGSLALGERERRSCVWPRFRPSRVPAVRGPCQLPAIQ